VVHVEVHVEVPVHVRRCSQLHEPLVRGARKAGKRGTLGPLIDQLNGRTTGRASRHQQ